MGDADAAPVEMGDEAGVAELDRKERGLGKGRGTMVFEMDAGADKGVGSARELPAGVPVGEVGHENYGTEKSWGRGH